MTARRLVSALVSGALLGAGLVVGGMTDPRRIIGFLDVGGAWDPTLLFVMAGAVGVHALLQRLVLRRSRPLFGATFALPTRRDLDARLLGGAALFGVGWGLAGYCPGPALVGAPTGAASALAFLAAMLVAMRATMTVEARLAIRRGAAATAARASASAGESTAARPDPAPPRPSVLPPLRA